MIQGVWDDLNTSTVDNWKYPDTGVWDPTRNTNEFVAAMPSWKSKGLLAFTVGLQGGCPYGYCSSQPWISSAFTSNGTLRLDWFDRLNLIVTKADDLGMIVILQLFYQGQAPKMDAGDSSILLAVSGVTNWLCEKAPTNVIIDLVNECNADEYTHELLKPPPGRITNLIQQIQSSMKQCHVPILVSTSFTGGTIPSQSVIDISDFILIHGNGQTSTSITNLINTIRKMSTTLKPIVINEDDHYDFNFTSNNCQASVIDHTSWGYFDGCTSDQAGNYIDGYQCPPTNWTINTQRKQDFFNYVYQITTGAVV